MESPGSAAVLHFSRAFRFSRCKAAPTYFFFFVLPFHWSQELTDEGFRCSLCFFFVRENWIQQTGSIKIKMISGRARSLTWRERKETSDGAIVIVVHDERYHISVEQRHQTQYGSQRQHGLLSLFLIILKYSFDFYCTDGKQRSSGGPHFPYNRSLSCDVGIGDFAVENKKNR